ncbi:hypothetical protein ACOSP7_013398 [Xanthoceras sorbifolium]
MPFAPFTGVNHHLQSIQFGSMGGRHPASIITDQDLAMKGAIAKVLPDAHHRLYLWHIKKKRILKKSGRYYGKWIKKNEWLNHLYEIRALWVPSYNHRNFFAGMNTTGRSESTNSFFLCYEDFESEHKYRIVDDEEFLLKHASQLFTRRVFNKFKDEWYQLNLQTYKGMCECQNFEFVGILCRHFLKIFVRLDIDMIPDHFVLPRWKQEANKFRIMDSKDHLVKNDGKEELEALRLGHMCHQATKLACITASSNEKYMIYMEALNELSKKFSEVSEHQTKIFHKKDDPRTSIHFPQPLLLDPNISQTKGRKKDVESSRRIKSGIEVALNKKKRTCKLCSKFGHDKDPMATKLSQKMSPPIPPFGILVKIPSSFIYSQNSPVVSFYIVNFSSTISFNYQNK